MLGDRGPVRSGSEHAVGHHQRRVGAGELLEVEAASAASEPGEGRRRENRRHPRENSPAGQLEEGQSHLSIAGRVQRYTRPAREMNGGMSDSLGACNFPSPQAFSRFILCSSFGFMFSTAYTIGQ